MNFKFHLLDSEVTIVFYPVKMCPVPPINVLRVMYNSRVLNAIPNHLLLFKKAFGRLRNIVISEIMLKSLNPLPAFISCDKRNNSEDGTKSEYRISSLVGNGG